MCQRGTSGAAGKVVVGLMFAWIAAAQTIPSPVRLDWRHVGGTSVDLTLASPATGPVRSVWYSPDGSELYAQTAKGKIFATRDFELWTAAPGATPLSLPEFNGDTVRLPEPGARLVRDPRRADRLYALGAHLYRSADEGNSWTDLTGYGEHSVIGDGITGLAVSPREDGDLVVSNAFGVWRSLDDGLAWAGLNQNLPNFPVARILADPGKASLVRVVADGFGELEAAAWISRQWLPADQAAPDAAAELQLAYSRAIGATVTASAAAGDLVYAGTAAGALYLSMDRGRTWSATNAPATGPINALFVDPQEPRTALAVAASRGPRVLRTTNAGIVWEDLTANLGEVEAHGVAADRSSGAIYVATERGLYYTRGDLVNPSPATPWTLLSGNLPEAPAMDVQLGAGGSQIYVALYGYGIYAAATPRQAGLRWFNAADYSSRPAAPGSLLSISGGKVERAEAGGLNFPVLAASDAESQVQVPYEAAGPMVSLAVEASAGRATLPLPVQDVSPAIFVDRDGVPMLLDADSGLMLGPANTARSRSRIQIFATGLGKVKPTWPTGLAAPLENPPEVITPVGVFLDGAAALVTRAVLAPGYIGFYLVEIQLPAIVNSGPAELYLVAGGRESNRVRIYLEP